MRRIIIHPAIGLLTFAIGIGLSSLFYNASHSPVRVIKPGIVVQDRAHVLEERKDLSIPCGCGRGEDIDLAGDDSAVPRAPISGGVLNSRAIRLPVPAYPAIARVAHASGTVTVQVVINENGCVISSRAVSGHPLLQSAAEKAGYEACFTATRLSGEPVKVSGVIIYNFVIDGTSSHQRKF